MFLYKYVILKTSKEKMYLNGKLIGVGSILT